MQRPRLDIEPRAFARRGLDFSRDGVGTMDDYKDYERTDRVSQKLHEIVAQILIEDLRDPGLSGVEITDVEVSPDIKHATVYFVTYGDEDGDEKRRRAKSALDRATGYIKREVAQQLDTKYTPDLAFEYDESIERGRRIETLLAQEAASDDVEDPDAE
jgi:ribosome-binding factor A